MNRRQFLQGTGLFAAAASFPSWALAEEDPYFAGFHQALKQHPWLNAYRGAAGDLESGPIPFTGNLPTGLRGTLYRNGPALFERGGMRYQHWFDGDGMIQAYRFSEQGLEHRGRFVQTRKFITEKELGKFIFPGFGTRAKSTFPGVGPDAFNAANTNVIAHAGRLLALWEGGSAYELDPASLDTRGTVVWRDDLKGVPFSAHPKVEPDGTLWNFGAFNDTLVLYQIGADGRLVKAEAVNVPSIVMNHDFVVSQNHLIFVLPSMRLSMEKLRSGSPILDAIDISLTEPMRVLTVEKGDFSRRRFYELPPGFVFHFGNAWETPEGQIRFDYVRSAPGARVMTDTMRALMRGDVANLSFSEAYSTLVTIDPKRGTIKQQSFADDVEFPRVDPRRVADRNRHLYHSASVGSHDQRFGLNAVLRYDLESGTRDLYRYGNDFHVEEHIMVPRPRSTREGDGWLVGCAFNVKTLKTELSVFDALNLADGPIAQAKIPYAIPLGFHGHFRAA